MSTRWRMRRGTRCTPGSRSRRSAIRITITRSSSRRWRRRLTKSCSRIICSSRPDDPKMRAYIINRQIDDIRGTLFRQTMFAEFEKIIHAIEERGDALTLEVFKTEYRAAATRPTSARRGARPGSSISNACASRISTAHSMFTNTRPAFRPRSRWRSGCSPAPVEASKRISSFLRSGGSKFPLETLQTAGVDMTSAAPVESTLRLFDRRLRELEALLT